MHQTISEKFFINLLGTLVPLYPAFIFGLLYFVFNQNSRLSSFVSAHESEQCSDYDSVVQVGFPVIKNYLNPYYVPGFADAEGSFILSIYKNNKKSELSWSVLPKFAINLHLKDKGLLENIQSFFGVGRLSVDYSNNKVQYSVNSAKDLVNVIIPHFERYPLCTVKHADYLLFKSAPWAPQATRGALRPVLLFKEKKHLTIEGLQQIVNIRASINKGLTETLLIHFPDTKPATKPLTRISDSINPHWLLGFVEGESCFFISSPVGRPRGLLEVPALRPRTRSLGLGREAGVTKNSSSKSYASLLFKLTQHSRDGFAELIKQIAKYLDCGFIVEKADIVTFNCKKLDILDKIIPFFYKYPLIALRPRTRSLGLGREGQKKLDSADFYKVAMMASAKNKLHLTPKGWNELEIIKAGMNRNRGGDKITINKIQKREYHSTRLYLKSPEQRCHYFMHVQLRGMLTRFYIWINYYIDWVILGEAILRLCVSYNFMYTAKVKIPLNKNNSQVTNPLNSVVGTSEAIRLININKRSIHKLSNSDRDLKFKQWLAGLIDGDGSFSLSKLGYASLEITMDIRDEHALQIIKNVYGGSIKLRSNAKALRYRLHHKSGLLQVINDVNGHIRNPHRLVQLNKICIKYDLNLIWPEKLTEDNGWFSGFFDADGTITINKSNTQLSISAGQKTSELLAPLVDLYGGHVYIDNGSSTSFKWYLTKREDVLRLIEYFKKQPSRSAKNKRLHLVPQFYELKDMKAHLMPETLRGKAFKLFMDKWDKFDDTNYSLLPLRPRTRSLGLGREASIKKNVSTQKRNFSSFGYSSLQQRPSHNGVNKISNNLLSSWYVTGFSDAEASFTVTFAKRAASKTGYFVQPSFQINLDKDDLALLGKIKTFFQDAGTITKPGPNSNMYRVRSLDELNNIIIPHFSKYPLKTQKQADFQLFTKIVDLLNNKEHLTMDPARPPDAGSPSEGLSKIASIKASMNNGLTEKIKTDFSNITPSLPWGEPCSPREETSSSPRGASLRNNIESRVPNPQWLVGFVEGEGSFWISIKKKTISKVGGTPNLVFQINQHSRDANLINSLVEYLGCGKIKVEEGKKIVNFQVSRFT
uniref:LAGLIDADG endonuclease n=1 Tax=Juglanconis oblonga TaxID=1940568 RepID=A0A291LI33_9PEZI|nr:LAGLIDADG endonuclease [Juglanconis oblonga]